MGKLWTEKQLGNHSPEAFIYSLWLNNTMHFGWGARDEHRIVVLSGLQLRQEQAGET